jgi:hypothetical protein
MSESQKKEPSELFTIQFDQVNDSSEIPGIAELLGSKTSMKTSTEEKKAGVKFNRPALQTSVKTLKEFGTRLEVHFLLNEDCYQYIQHNDLTSRKFFGLDDLFHEMKIPLVFAQDIGAFSEFSPSEKQYLFDAFGITEQPYLQFILNQKNKILSVYVSEKSMKARKDDIISFVENKNQNLSASSLDPNQEAA